MVVRVLCFSQHNKERSEGDETGYSAAFLSFGKDFDQTKQHGHKHFETPPAEGCGPHRTYLPCTRTVSICLYYSFIKMSHLSQFRHLTRIKPMCSIAHPTWGEDALSGHTGKIASPSWFCLGRAGGTGEEGHLCLDCCLCNSDINIRQINGCMARIITPISMG